MSKATRLSLVMPAYNEAAGIVEAIREAHASLRHLDYEFEILVVNDGSHDATADLVRDCQTTMPEVHLLSHPRNLGYGAALRTGFEAARYELVAFTDADGQFYLEEVDDLVALTRTYPIVVGWRVDRQDPAKRRFLSWGYNHLVRFFLGTGVRDCDCALKVFRYEMLGRLLPRTNGFFVNAEMLSRARQLGWQIGEVGVRHRARRHGESKVSLWEVPKTLTTLLRFWFADVLLRRRRMDLVSPSWPEPVALERAPVRDTNMQRAA